MSFSKITTLQWERFSQQITSSKQTVQQLSKLYIVIHQKVKSSIKKSVLNPQTNFSDQALHHIEFIKNVIQKIKQAEDDQYLIQVQKQMLKKYQKSLAGLLDQIQIMLKIQQSKINLDFDSLKNILPQKREKYDLKDEVQLSSKRVVRAKSGCRKKLNYNSDESPVKQSEKVIQNSFFPTTINIQEDHKLLNIRNEDDVFQLFTKKRKALEDKIQNTISRTQNGLGILFQKKYQENNLQMYLKERKQLADLMFNQQIYDKIISQRQSENANSAQKSMNQVSSPTYLSKKQFKAQQLNARIFPQFQIKTKFLKPRIRQNITNLITEIKKELLEQYRLQNIKTLKEANQGGLITLSQKKKSNLQGISQKRSISNLRPNFPIPNNKQQTQCQTFKNKTLSKTHQDIKNKQKSIQIKRYSSYGDLKNSQNLYKTKRSFTKQNQKPFYETQNWTQYKSKKYQTQITSKLKLAKI